MLTCTWAPSTFAGPQVVKRQSTPRPPPTGAELTGRVIGHVQRLEALGLSHLLIAQRWWGNAREIEGSSLDCLAMTAFIAAQTTKVQLVTAIHPGFFQPAAIAKWGTTIDNLTGGRWHINVTSGWNLDEFSMYGVDPLTHDLRYERSKEFIDVLRGAWEQTPFSYSGDHYTVANLALEPRPTSPLVVFQGGQSDAAVSMACTHSDWMFLNGGTIEKQSAVIDKVRQVAGDGRCPRFAVYGIPICRPTDAEAQAVIETMLANVDEATLAARKKRVSGAEGMWSGADRLSLLDSNEGYATGLVGSPETIIRQVTALRSIGVEMLHFTLGDALFEDAVLPKLPAL